MIRRTVGIISDFVQVQNLTDTPCVGKSFLINYLRFSIICGKIHIDDERLGFAFARSVGERLKNSSLFHSVCRKSFDMHRFFKDNFCPTLSQ